MAYEEYAVPPHLTLYNLRGCPFCIRVKKHLARLDLEFVEIQVPRFRRWRKDVQRLSGQRQVPVLVDGERVIADSQTICEYLSAQYGRPSGAVGRLAPGAQLT